MFYKAKITHLIWGDTRTDGRTPRFIYKDDTCKDLIVSGCAAVDIISVCILIGLVWSVYDEI